MFDYRHIKARLELKLLGFIAEVPIGIVLAILVARQLDTERYRVTGGKRFLNQ